MIFSTQSHWVFEQLFKLWYAYINKYVWNFFPKLCPSIAHLSLCLSVNHLTNKASVTTLDMMQIAVHLKALVKFCLRLSCGSVGSNICAKRAQATDIAQQLYSALCTMNTLQLEVWMHTHKRSRKTNSDQTSSPISSDSLSSLHAN